MSDGATDALCRSWLDLRWQIDPAAASAAGVREHDGRLGRFDDEALRPMLSALKALAGAAEDLDVDSAEEEIDRTALLEELRIQLWGWERERPQVRNPAFWLGHLFDGLQALDRRPGPAAAIAPALLERLRGAPEFLQAALATLDRPPLVFIDQALAQLGGGGELLARLAARVAADHAEGAPELAQAATSALEALRGFGERLGQEVEPDHDPHAFAAGEEAFARRLHHEHALGSGAPELHRAALHLREELVQEIAREARAFDAHRPWQDVVASIAERRPAPEHAPAVLRGELARAAEFLQDRALVEVPAGVLDVAVLPPHRRGSGLTAAYLPPAGTEEGAHALLALEPDAVPSFAEVPALAARLGLPGRHLFELHARAAGSEVRRTLRAPLTADGWSLYAMDLLAEEAYFREPEDRLFRHVALLHAVLLVELDIALHTRGLPRGEAIDLLCAHLPLPRRTADAEVRRLCSTPTHGLTAAVGRRELRSIRDAVRRQQGQAFRAGEFHARALAYGGLPPALIRWGLGLGQ